MIARILLIGLAMGLSGCDKADTGDTSTPGDTDTDTDTDSDTDTDTDTDSDTDTDTDTDSDTDSDTDPAEPYVAPDRVGLSGGGRTRAEGGGYRLNITVGDPLTAHAASGGKLKLRLGVGTTQDSRP